MYRDAPEQSFRHQPPSAPHDECAGVRTYFGSRVSPSAPPAERAEVHRGDEPAPPASLSPGFAAQTTTASAREAAGNSRQYPRIPATPGAEGPGQAGIPADPRSARKRQDRPVTPEVAGSSPVAPVKGLQISI